MDLHIENQGQENDKEMIERAQTTLITWHKVLRFNGGELKIEKCYWTKQSYKWKDNKAILIKENSDQLTLDINGELKPNPYIPP